VGDHLSDLRRDLEAQIDPPDFGVVAARGRAIRRRRRVSAAAGVAVAVVVAVVLSSPFGNRRVLSPLPVPPRPAGIDRSNALPVLRDADAQVDVERSAVSGAGDVLSVVVVPSRGFGAPDPCRGDWEGAFRWMGTNGTTRAWTDHAETRAVRPLASGFVVGAVPPGCRSGEAGEAQAYVVDASGRARPIAWDDTVTSSGLLRTCSVTPGDERCRFTVSPATGGVDPAGKPSWPAGSTRLTEPDAELLWAGSADSRRLSWSEDAGRTWSSRTSTLPGGENVTVTAAGNCAAFTTSTQVEYTFDGGTTWHRRDLSGPLRPIEIADVSWTLTPSGLLLGVTTLVGKGDVLFRSTDSSWRRFETTKVHTSLGTISPTVVGSTVYVPDSDRWLVSRDGFATWEVREPLR